MIRGENGSKHTMSQATEIGERFCEVCRQTENELQSAGTTLPSQDQKTVVNSGFWDMWNALLELENTIAEDDIEPAKEALRRVIGPCIWRSEPYYRSYFKPHGYAGDFGIIELMYDLEQSAGDDPTIPGIVNCLDHTFTTIHSVQSVWERRHWLSGLLLEATESGKKTTSILDLACGGARYIRDYFEAAEPEHNARFTLVDQDPTAIEFCRRAFDEKWLQAVQLFRAQALKPHKQIENDRFDLIISSGLFDYLPAVGARRLVSQLLRSLAPGGLLAITNFHKDDPSRVCKEWGADWNLILRSEDEVMEFFPTAANVDIRRSDNGALVYATAQKN